MMTREERAKQFMSFDAMKGLKQALSVREERRSRVSKHEITEEQKKINSEVLRNLNKYDVVSLDCHSDFHDININGRVTEINLPFKFICIDGEKIDIENIYTICRSD